MRGYFGIGLYQPVSLLNIGSVLRSANCFDASFVVVQESNTKLKHVKTDTAKTAKHLPVFTGNVMGYCPPLCVPVAIEIVDDARDLTTFTHPERAYYIFGPEDGSLPNEVLDYCIHKVSIPTKYCLNLGTCVAVLCYDRIEKGKR